jgi:hypothetical protein
MERLETIANKCFGKSVSECDAGELVTLKNYMKLLHTEEAT